MTTPCPVCAGPGYYADTIGDYPCKCAPRFDPKCEELARHFLGDSPEINERCVAALAEHIHNAVDLWLDEVAK
jgi:hypothetical protein